VQSQVGSDLFYGSDQPGVVSVNGGRGRSNNYTVNGGDANDQFANLPGVQPSPDTIEEFRVLTNSFDAEFGRNSGAVVNVVTKSGTNALHGDLYEFFRNNVLNARGFFDTAKPDFKQNQFGGTLGGPIHKDQTFFFSSYEGRRIRQGTPSPAFPVPTLPSGRRFFCRAVFRGNIERPQRHGVRSTEFSPRVRRWGGRKRWRADRSWHSLLSHLSRQLYPSCVF